MNALVVDDSRTMRAILARALQELGISVVGAASAEEALVMLQADDAPDLIMADWHMPGTSGLDFVRALRRDERFDATKVMMVSAEGIPALIGEAMRAGANEYLVKPFDAVAIAEKLALMNLPLASSDGLTDKD